jgi:hypothetical protein
MEAHICRAAAVQMGDQAPQFLDADCDERSGFG